MKSLLAGEYLKETVSVKCRFGSSTLYLSNLGIMIENHKGVVLDLEHNSILSLQPFGKKFIKIVWREDYETYDFVFSYERPAELAVKYKTIQKDYYDSLKIIGMKIDQFVNEKITIQNPIIEPKPL